MACRNRTNRGGGNRKKKTGKSKSEGDGQIVERRNQAQNHNTYYLTGELSRGVRKKTARGPQQSSIILGKASKRGGDHTVLFAYAVGRKQIHRKNPKEKKRKWEGEKLPFGGGTFHAEDTRHREKKNPVP